MYQDIAYDADKNITHLTVATPDKLLAQNTYRYDGNGQRVEKNELAGKTLYTYDSLNRLAQAEYPTYTERFTYDQSGNRLTRTAKDIEEHYVYDVNNRLTQRMVNGQVEIYRYDNAGNLLQDGSTTYEYDTFRRTSKVTTNTENTQINRYDAEGLRYEMEENGNLVQFIFNENKEVIAEQEGDNITRLIRTSDLWAMESEPEKTWYHYAGDEQGSTIFITDKAGSVKNRYAYDAFGNTIESAEQIPNRYQYTGQQFDPITQQYYLRARFYNPAIARFTQEDEYHGDGLNLYAYCANNPVDYYDPSGYCKKNVYATSIDDKVTKIDKIMLPDSLAKTYLDSEYRTVVTNEDILVYRTFGGWAEAGGSFATTVPAGNRISAKINTALLPKWKNTMMYEACITVPKGTILQIGKVAPQTTNSGAVLKGLGDQILLPRNWPLEWIDSIKCVPAR